MTLLTLKPLVSICHMDLLATCQLTDSTLLTIDLAEIHPGFLLA